MTRKKSTCLAVLAILLSPMVANATVIDFESLALTECSVRDGGSVDGFTLGAHDGDSGAGFINSSLCPTLASPANSGSQYMTNFNRVFGEFTRNVGTFSLISLFVHADFRVGDTTVRFQGLDGIGGSVLYSMDVEISDAWQQVVFPDWIGVTTFTWDSLVPDSSNISIDDFEYGVASVPEPGTLALLGLGLLGMASRRRKKV